MKKIITIISLSFLGLIGIAIIPANQPAEVAGIKSFIPAGQNLDGVQFEEVRKIIDPLYKAVHDELSTAYYNQTAFRTKGVLTREQFENYQALLWAQYEVRFSQEVQKMPVSRRYPETEYNEIENNGIKTKKSDMAATRIQTLKLQGYELTF